MKKYLVVGFCVGVAVSILFLFLDSHKLLSPDSDWVEILLYPGIFAGWFVYNTWHLDDNICIAVGVLAMGFVFGILACVLRFIAQFRGTKHSGKP